jgi:hypothetical protein
MEEAKRHHQWQYSSSSRLYFPFLYEANSLLKEIKAKSKVRRLLFLGFEGKSVILIYKKSSCK